ncbi:PQQ-binding-like beta-propeller repeat protein [bacterium]|nr:PQQ-binding-like beta-propeller repeat protein [bacterium]
MDFIEFLYLVLFFLFLLVVLFFGVRWVLPDFYPGIRSRLSTWWSVNEEETKKRIAQRYGLLFLWDEIEDWSQWAFECPERIKQVFPTEDSLIVGTERKLYFLDRETGELGQEYELDKPFMGMYIDGDRLYLFLKGEVLCLPPYLLPIWKTSIHYDNFLLDNERLFLWDSVSHKFHCLEKSSGKELWSRLALLFFNFYDWTQDEDNLYTLGSRFVIAWRKIDGTELWKFRREEWSILSGRAGMGSIYVYDHPYDRFFCLNKNGKKIWEKNVGRTYWTYLEQVFEEATLFKASILPLGRGVLLVTGGEVYLFKGDDGKLIWRSVGYIPPGVRLGIVTYSSILYQEGERFVYFMGNFQIEDVWWVHRVSLADGEVLRITRSPYLSTINADKEFLYLGTIDGKLYALRKETLGV